MVHGHHSFEQHPKSGCGFLWRVSLITRHGKTRAGYFDQTTGISGRPLSEYAKSPSWKPTLNALKLKSSRAAVGETRS